MIVVKRSDQPRVLIMHGYRWLAELKSIRLKPKESKFKIDQAVNKYRHREIKDRLVEMFHGKCAYCESKITVITYGNIEHFRPKSLFEDLTFTWSNLLLACDICNDSGHKANKFPLDSDNKPLLIDPTEGFIDISRHLEFTWDSDAQLASVYGRDNRGKEVVSIFDLNGIRGRSELIKYRSRYVRNLVVLAHFAVKGDEQSLDILRGACQPDVEYSAFAKSVCDKFGLSLE